MALVSFDGRVYPNEAHTWDRLGRRSEGPNLLENALEHWFPFATGRHTWISVQGQTIRGVVSARPRGSRLAWEVDCLIVASEDEDAVLLALLDQLTEGAVDARVPRVFLRIEAGSEVLEVARRSGFMPLCDEWLYRLGGELPEAPLHPDVQLRERVRGDGFPLFRLYNQVVPGEVRRLEAATYAEWIAAQETRGRGRGRFDRVAEAGGDLVAWLRAVPDDDTGRIDLLVHPEGMRHAPALLSRTVKALGGRRPLYCLAPSYARGLAALLEDAGFVRDGEYVSLMKRLALPVREAKPIRLPVHQPIASAVIASRARELHRH